LKGELLILGALFLLEGPDFPKQRSQQPSEIEVFVFFEHGE